MNLYTLAKCNGVTFRTGSTKFNFLQQAVKNHSLHCIIFRQFSSSFIQLQNKYRPKLLEKKDQHKELDIRIKRMAKLAENGWINTKYFDIFPWSVSGVETCVVARNPEIAIAFDMGYTFPDSVKCPSVLIRYVYCI